MPGEAERAIRATVRGRVQGVAFRAATVAAGRELGLLGWVRNQPDGSVLTHAEGEAGEVAAFEAFLEVGPAGARVDELALAPAKVEGHEQFAIRGVPAGAFRVDAAPPGARAAFILRLELSDGWRSWALSKPPSMVPAEKRFASALGAADAAPAPAESWDAGSYEQGGRVAWPEAIERGHAVFVLHGERLRGGFALQRTRGSGAGAGWLLIKRRDAFAATLG